MSTKNQQIACDETLVKLGGENPDITMLEADLGKSSSTFGEMYPERHLKADNAEKMLSRAAELAASGKAVFASMFAASASGAHEQIRRTIAAEGLDVNICGLSSGISGFADDPDNQAVEDVAVISTIPNMTVLTPCDAAETRGACSAAETRGTPAGAGAGSSRRTAEG